MTEPSPSVPKAPEPASGAVLPNPPAPAQPTRTPSFASETAYQPLSVLAVVGLLVGVGYAVGLMVMAGGAFASGTPSLLPVLVVVFFPLLGLGLSVAAWVHINNSEGTLSGLRLARWGIWLSLLTGFGYLAYYAATFFAVREEARGVSETFFKKLSEDQTLSAFLLTLDPTVRPREDPNKPLELRRDVEKRFNPAQESSPRGPLGFFQHCDLVRFLRQAGPEAKWDLLHADGFSYEKGGFRIKLKYRLSGPEASANVTVSLQQGTEESQGQWHVVMGETTMPADIELTDLGRQRAEVRLQASDYIRAWVRDLIDKKTKEAFLETCEPDQRAKLSENPEPPGYKEFLEGSLVTADRLWTDNPGDHEKMTQAVQLLFKNGVDFANSLKPETSPWHFCKIDGKEVVFEQAFLVGIPSSRSVIEIVLLLEGPAEAVGKGTPIPWRVRAVDLQSGRAMQALPQRMTRP
jgi:hypothetical protein